MGPNRARTPRFQAVCGISMALTLGAVLAGAASPAGHTDSSDRITRTISWRAGVPIWVEATIADLTVTGSDRADVVVEIVRNAPLASDLTKFPVVIDDQADGLHIVNVQSMDQRDPRLKAALTIKAPST